MNAEARVMILALSQSSVWGYFSDHPGVNFLVGFVLGMVLMVWMKK